MDFFGIGAAIKGMALTYFNVSRGTGRTVSIVESVKDGDRVIFDNAREAGRVQKLCLESGIKIEVAVIAPENVHNIYERGASQRRTIFDHGWVERYYLNAINRCQKDIDQLQTELSGNCEAHKEARRKAIEVSRWSSGV